jgi:hypothetical protein
MISRPSAERLPRRSAISRKQTLPASVQRGRRGHASPVREALRTLRDRFVMAPCARRISVPERRHANAIAFNSLRYRNCPDFLGKSRMARTMLGVRACHHSATPSSRLSASHRCRATLKRAIDRSMVVRAVPACRTCGSSSSCRATKNSSASRRRARARYTTWDRAITTTFFSLWRAKGSRMTPRGFRRPPADGSTSPILRTTRA